MAESQVQGKSLNAIARDVADGYAYLNALVLKKFEVDAFKSLYQRLKKIQRDIRGERFPTHDTQGIRERNIKLQRIHQALMVLENTARERKVLI